MGLMVATCPRRRLGAEALFAGGTDRWRGRLQEPSLTARAQGQCTVGTCWGGVAFESPRTRAGIESAQEKGSLGHVSPYPCDQSG